MLKLCLHQIIASKSIVKRNFNKKSLANLVQYRKLQPSKLELSTSIKTKIRNTLTNWLNTEKKFIATLKRNSDNKALSAIAPNGRNCDNANVITNKKQITMITLTFPTELQAIGDKELKRKYLNTFLNHISRKGVTHWFWIAETQRNEALHFHLLVNEYSNEFANYWKQLTDNYNSSAIKTRPVNHIDKVVEYLTKDTNNRIIDGRRYGMSKPVKEFESIKITDVIEENKFMSNQIKRSQLVLSFEHDFFIVLIPKNELRKHIQSRFMKLRKRQQQKIDT